MSPQIISEGGELEASLFVMVNDNALPPDLFPF